MFKAIRGLFSTNTQPQAAENREETQHESLDADAVPEAKTRVIEAKETDLAVEAGLLHMTWPELEQILCGPCRDRLTSLIESKKTGMRLSKDLTGFYLLRALIISPE